MAIKLAPMTPADLGTVYSILSRINTGDRSPMVTPLWEVEEWASYPHLDLALDSRIALLDDEPVGYGIVFHTPSGERLERVFLAGGVDPAARGRGVGREIFAWQVERGKEKVAPCDPELPKYLRTFGFEWMESAFRLYRRFGFQPVRYYEELLRPLTQLPDLVESEEITVKRWDPSCVEQARVVRNHAFADHWGSTPMDEKVWEHLLDSKGVRTDLSFMGFVRDRLAGFSLTEVFADDERVTGRKDAWIALLGVEAEHRKKGVATALLVASFHAFAEEGFTHAAIGVDSENLTGAHQLYRRLGFELAHRSVSYQLEVGYRPRGTKT